jgi:hypothetical protein
MDSAIEKIRANVSLFDVWRDLKLPGTPRLGDQCSPLRDDKRASFTIYQAKGHLRFHDHGSGEGGDCVDLWARAKQISVKEAIDDILASMPHLGDPAKALNRPPEASGPQEGILWPDNLAEPSTAECQQLGQLRGLSSEAFFLAGKLGTLFMGDKRGQRIWMTVDRKMRSAAMRRLDGKNLELINSKSASPKNASRDWIIGSETSNPKLDRLKSIVLVEGEGDYYAALQLAITSEISFRVLAILGASQKTFHKDCQAQFIHASVLILPHNDRSQAGEKAANLWTTLFYSWGAIKVAIQHLPIVCNDLNDFLIQRPDAGQKLLKDFHNGSIRSQG